MVYYNTRQILYVQCTTYIVRDNNIIIKLNIHLLYM